MAKHKVTEFRPYDFKVGEKIRIAGGPRAGDWEVVDAGEKKVRLRCPISGREFEWARFCYFLDARELVEWPSEQ
ncbi:MAG: hypothetical protein QGD94_00665 [Planctomycetia bacterium]|nr:hypothetical protein [Planctomycetia bacterium]